MIVTVAIINIRAGHIDCRNIKPPLARQVVTKTRITIENRRLVIEKSDRESEKEAAAAAGRKSIKIVAATKTVARNIETRSVARAITIVIMVGKDPVLLAVPLTRTTEERNGAETRLGWIWNGPPTTGETKTKNAIGNTARNLKKKPAPIQLERTLKLSTNPKKFKSRRKKKYPAEVFLRTLKA